MGVVKGVKATLEGMTGVFKTLMEQHGEASTMLKRAERDEGKRNELWPKIRRELLSHERGEMRVVYPELRLHDETRGFAEQHDREAGELEAAIGALDKTAVGEWDRPLEELIELVDAHVALEENTIFPKAIEVLGKDRARELDDEFLAAKKSAMESA
jgi:hemerythrin superfamily protein